MFVGTKIFSELADYYYRHGEYPYESEYNEIFADLNRDSKVTILPTFDDFTPAMQEFALYWIDKFVNGDSSGNMQITGEHSFYLNCCWITRNRVNEFGRVSRGGGFPDFWDEDYKYYWTCDIARFGITRHRYEILKSFLDFNLLETDRNLSGGLDVLYLKPRGVGASWKGGAKACYNMFLIPESNTFILADKEAYLTGDGIFDKFNKLRSFIIKHCWWIKKSFVKESASSFEFETGTKINVGGGKANDGFGSKVNGITIDGDKEKARGIRGDFLFEEFGSFPEVDDTWGVTDAGVEEYGVIFGQRRGFGTGGDSNGGIISLKKMTYDPASYRVIQFKNIYDEMRNDKPICLFTPAYRNITHKDEHGNSNEEKGKKWLEEKEAIETASTDVTKITKFKAEFCRTPADAFKGASVNILPVELAEECLNFLERTDFDRRQCTYGTMSKGYGRIEFKPVPGLLPYEEFPATTDKRDGCIAIWKKPYKNSQGRTPNGMYIIPVDAYTQDSDGGKSIGSVAVIEQPNKYTTYKGDCEVAWYDGRPEGFDGLGIFAANIFFLAEYYNALVSLENDQVGDVISYAKKHTDSKGRKLTIYLAEQFDLAFDEKIQMKKTMNRAFGMNMTDKRFLQGLVYYQQWLLTPRGINSEGKTILNIHLLMSRGVLKEIKDFNGDNADRLSCRIIGMYHLRENEDKLIQQAQSAHSVLKTLKLF